MLRAEEEVSVVLCGVRVLPRVWRTGGRSGTWQYQSVHRREEREERAAGNQETSHLQTQRVTLCQVLTALREQIRQKPTSSCLLPRSLTRVFALCLDCFPVFALHLL